VIFNPEYPLELSLVCGTLGYVSPEIISQSGHSHAADHWSLGILIYELVTGENPFYFDGMDQVSLFNSIVHDEYPPPKRATAACQHLIDQLLVKDPRHRLGSLAGGERAIFRQEWFGKIDLTKYLHRMIPAPWTPKMEDVLDTSNFDDWSDLPNKTDIESSMGRLTPLQAQIFEAF
jgi:serine/threonine protein kinase